MTNLISIQDKEGQLVVSSRLVAEHFEKQHKNVLEGIRNLVAENSATKLMFIESDYKNRGKQYPEYLLTRDGFTLLAMGFTGNKALEWKLKYIEAFNQMEQQLKNPLAGISTELQAILLQDKKLQVVETRVEKLENNMTIDYGQKKELRDIGNRKVLEVLGGKHALAYKLFGKKAFAEIWKHYKNTMNINSYENTAVKEFARAKEILISWMPSQELHYAIIGINTQIRKEVDANVKQG